MHRWGQMAIALVAMGSTLTGCGGGSDQENRDPSVSGGPRTSETRPVPVNPFEGAAKDLKDVRCAADAKTGEWTFTATLTNSSDKDSHYTVRVSIIKKQGSTVVASKDVFPKVASGQSADVRLERFAKPAEKPDELQCVPTTTVARG